MPASSLCIFDLDGTLVDSLRDVAEAFNEGLDLLGLAPQPVESYRFLVGEGVPALCRKVIGHTHPHLCDRLSELVRARYRTRLLRYTMPYPGVPEAVERLAAAGFKLAVLSNKPHPLTERIVRALWPGGVFERVQGYVSEEHRKPHPYHVLQIAGELGAPLERTWVVGDTAADIEAARRAGALSIAVTWGFRPRESLEACGAQRLVETPQELPAALGV